MQKTPLCSGPGAGSNLVHTLPGKDGVNSAQSPREKWGCLLSKFTRAARSRSASLQPCYFLVHCTALHLHTWEKLVKTRQGETLPSSHSELTSCFRAVVRTHTQLQLLHIINVLIIHNYLITKEESQSKCSSKDIETSSF